MTNEKLNFLQNDEDKKLFNLIDPKKRPKHIALIMDGNGRWAKERNMERIKGHEAGSQSVKKIIESALGLGIRYITLYAFSSENWKRPTKEVNKLMNMLYENLVSQEDYMIQNKICLKVIGDQKRLPAKLRKRLDEAELKTAKLKKLQINLALNYGSRNEIVNACKRIVQEGISADKITEKVLSNYLYTGKCPDPDLLVRTSGELRISNFLLYQIAYSELYFTKTLWPDFDGRELMLAIIDYQKRDRRFGRA